MDAPGLSHPLPRGGVLLPDGRLQLGLGPQAWVVEGWHPGRRGPDAATALLSAWAPRAQAPDLPPPDWEVRGAGRLADRLRSARAEGPAPAGRPPTPGCPVPDRPVVLVCGLLVPVGTAREADVRGRAVLPVVGQHGRVVVGPWTGLPGGPCLHCLDLHRTDHDPAWPQLAARLDDPLSEVEPRQPPEVLDLVEALVLLLVRREGPPRGHYDPLSYEVGEERPHLVTRRWPPHPACPWHRADEAGRA